LRDDIVASVDITDISEYISNSPELALIVANWAALPVVVRNAIVGMVKASGGETTERVE
jgi:hypothetical protein